MAAPVQLHAFTVGEVAPGLFGRQDLVRMGVAASTMRNMFVRYTGGASSRAGLKFCGFSKQTGRVFPPRLIDFKFSARQGLALEFGHHYMRVIQDGAYVTENPISISNISQANPAQVTVGGASGAGSATANNGGVVSSYVPGELITIAGGTFVVPAVLSVTRTLLIYTQTLNPGTGYVPGDLINLAGGVQTVQSQIIVATTQVVSATIAAAGAGGTDGPAVVVGTTGVGVPFQANVTITGGVITSVDSIAVGGAYSTNPAVPANEPVTGAGLVGAALNVVLGVNGLGISIPGEFTTNAPGGTFTQLATTGVGVGATFNFALFGIAVMGVSSAGVYSATPANPASQSSTTGSGLGATYNIAYGAASPFANGDWVFIDGVLGMTQINGGIYVVANATPTTVDLVNVYGQTVSSVGFSPYLGGGTISRIYTLTTQWAEEDLKWLKYSQSADVMTLTCLNQDSGVEYIPLDLARLANNNWVFEPVIEASSVSAPTGGGFDASAGGTTFYQYRITAVDPETGQESIAGPIINVPNMVNIAATAGSIVLSWVPVENVQVYNVYKATPGYGRAVPTGVLFGFIGQAYGPTFIDSNSVPDFTQTPPLPRNPFARGAVLGAIPVTGGAGYFTACTATINTATGSGAVLTTVVVNGVLQGIIVDDAGHDYLPTDTITITGDGAGATARLTVGELTGTYPSVSSYFQQRRVFGNSRNLPDTYWMSQPGAFRNFQTRIPTLDTDAITGSPWSVQVNGIQFMLNMPGGLVVLSGEDAWQLTGVGGSSFTPQPITPASQQAQPQAYNGCSPTMPPVKIDYDIIYLQTHGSIWRNFAYQYNTNIYTGIDLTLNSSQLFTNFEMRERAWCEEPFKVLWVVRGDGVLLSLTFVRPQEIAGWARHDTNGLFRSCCSVTEPPVDALYVAVERRIGDHLAYTVERMDNRSWQTVQDVWAVDCAAQLPQPEPAATLTASSATGIGQISGYTGLTPGGRYSAATTATVTDDNGRGPGTGCTVTLAIDAFGAITPTITNPGTGYVYPRLDVHDPSGLGSGFSCRLTLDNTAMFTASAAVFTVANIGNVIRMGGGIARITQAINPTTVLADIISPITQLVPNTDGVPQSQTAGNWTLTAPATVVGGLSHLIGATVTGLYDGKVIPPTVVDANGQITLPEAATAVVVGLSFGAQLQTVYLDMGTPTVQGRRKKVAAATARIEASSDFEIGANQPDGSVQSPYQLAPEWQNMVAGPTGAVAPYNADWTPLFTGDVRIPLLGGFDTKGQAAIQQLLPLPLNILSCIDEALPGDDVDIAADRRRQQGRSASVDT